MAEAFAVVGIITGIGQLADLTAKILHRVKEFQTKLQEFLSTRKAALLAKILEKKAFDKDLEAETKTALDEFKNLFK